MYESSYPKLRFKKTLNFVQKHIPKDEKILDLGVENPMSKLLADHNYIIQNTQGQDLDIEYQFINQIDFDCLTSFELFEHLLAPFNLLNSIQPKKGKQIRLVSSVPLNVWFSKAYWNEQDKWDRHYHEFEPRQYDMLLEKAGWKIMHSETWTSPSRFTLGIRPLLRYLYPSYYFVHAIKE